MAIPINLHQETYILDQKDQISQSISIVGMDFFTVEYPDLKEFKRMLIKGESDLHSPIDLTDQIEQSLVTIGITESAYKNQNLLEKLTQLVINRALSDACLGQSRSDKISLSIVIHSPQSTHNIFTNQGYTASQKPFENLLKELVPSLNVYNSKIIFGDFNSALKQARVFTQENESHLTVFISFFSYPNRHKSNSNSITEPEHFPGLGCLVLSKVKEIDSSYAELKIGNIINEQEIENYQQEKNKKHSSPPIVRLIKAAIEINDKTNFSNLQKVFTGSTENLTQNMIRPWFTLPYDQKRVVRLTTIDEEKDCSPIYLEKENQSSQHPDKPFRNFGFFLFPIEINNSNQAVRNIEDSISKLTECSDFESFITDSQNKYINQKSKTHTLVILGNSKLELLKELAHALKGVPSSFESGKDWQTPVGSFFTPKPLGPKEKISFVYPGAFNTYIGMGSEIFYLFPQLHDILLEITTDPGTAINEDTIFPVDPTTSIKEELQGLLNNNPTQMISSGVVFSFLFTVILRDILKVKPNSAFGYSLGENSMMFSMGLWSQADPMRTSLETSPIFHNRVSGPQNAIREFWNLPQFNNQAKDDSPIWANYVLMVPVEKVRAALKNERYVFLTHINTPRQVVIGGKPESCRQIIAELKCMYLQTPYNHAIHCKPVASEFEAFKHLHNWPVETKPEVPIYTAATYGTLPTTSISIAENFANMLTKPIDFPHLINLAYEDGARIFIELGAGSNCSKWIAGTLKGKPHIALSINQNTMKDHVSILRLIAHLVSHQIPVDLKVIVGDLK